MDRSTRNVSDALFQLARNLSNASMSVTLDNNTNPDNGKTQLTGLGVPQIPSVVSALYFALIITTLVVGIPGNIIITAAYVRVKNKSTCDWYIFFIAVFDVLACSFRVSGYLMEYLGLWSAHTTSGYCKFMTWISQTTVCMGNLLFALIALDRYAKICTFRRLSMKPTQSRNLCLAMIVITLALAAPCLYLMENLSRGVCSVKPEYIKSDWVAGYYSAMFLLFLAMMVIVVLCYACIFSKIRGTRRIFHHQATEARTNGVSVYVVNPTSDCQAGVSNQSHSTELRNTPTTSCLDTQKKFLPATHLNPSAPAPDSPSSHALGTDAYSSAAVLRSTTASAQSHNGDDHFGRLNPAYAYHHMSAATPVTAAPLKPNKSTKNVNVNKAQEMSRDRRQRRDFKITGLLFIVTVVFIISWIPPYVAMIKGFYIGYSFPLSVAEYTMLSYAPSTFMINNFANPLIYACFSGTFRRNVKEMIQAAYYVCKAR